MFTLTPLVTVTLLLEMQDDHVGLVVEVVAAGLRMGETPAGGIWRMALTFCGGVGRAGGVGAHGQNQRIDAAEMEAVEGGLGEGLRPGRIEGIFAQDDGAGGRDVVGEGEGDARIGIHEDAAVAMGEAVDGHVGAGVNFHGVLEKDGELEDGDGAEVDLLADAGAMWKPVVVFMAVEMIS